MEGEYSERDRRRKVSKNKTEASSFFGRSTLDNSG